MFDSVCNLMIIIFETICCKIFFDTFLESGENRKNIYIYILIIGNYFLTFWDYFALHIIQKESLVAIMLIACMYFYTNAGIKKVIIVSLLFQGLLLATDFITYIVYASLFPNFNLIQKSQIVESLSLIVFGKVLLFLCVITIRRKFGSGQARILEEKQWIKFLAFSLFTIMATIAMFTYFGKIQDKNQIVTLFMVAFGLVIMNLFVFEIIEDVAKRETELKEKEVFAIQGREQLLMYRSLADSYERQKQQTHEYANQMLCIRNLLREKQYEEVNEYVEEISGKFQVAQNYINTNHTVVNAIVNAKYREAEDKGIQVVFVMNDLSNLKVANDDLVIILANLLNNAIEACEKCEGKKQIKLKLVKEKRELIISVKNTFNGTIKKEKDAFITTKERNIQDHGVGIRNIIRGVERNQGYYNISHENNEFCFTIIIPL